MANSNAFFMNVAIYLSTPKLTGHCVIHSDQCHSMLVTTIMTSLNDTSFDIFTLRTISTCSIVKWVRSNRGLSNGPASSYVKSFSEEFHMRPYMATKEGVSGIKQWVFSMSTPEYTKGNKTQDVFLYSICVHLTNTSFFAISF